MMSFWRNFYRVEESSKFGAKLFWVQGTTTLEGVPRETTIGGAERGGGGGRFELIYLYVHQHESDAESEGEAFRAMFRD